MAKLSARGRRELVRMRKDLPDMDTCVRRKKYLVLMSDGNVLTKTTYDNTDVFGNPHNSGNWTVLQKFRDTREAFILLTQAKGFTQV